MIRISIKKKLNLADGTSELNVDTTLPLESISALYGRSGTGKTSLLKMLAGLMKPDEGFIHVNGETWFDSAKNINLPPQKRNIGFVFQDYALFPNMTVKENLLYAAGKNPDEEQINQLLLLTQLKSFADHKPETLSGGQKQRTALARALVRRPALLLLDEPLSAADQQTRIQLQQYLIQINQQYKITALLVTHDVAEIYSMASYVLNIGNGKVLRGGKPADVFAIPVTDNTLHLKGQIIKSKGSLLTVLVSGQTFEFTQNINNLKVGDHVKVMFDVNNGIIKYDPA